MGLKFLKENKIFVFIIFICAILRFIPLFEYQYTLDELSGLDRTYFSSFSELIEKGVKIDAHPAFVQILIYYLTQFFGYDNWIIKLPFILFSFGAIIYAYFFGLRNFSKQTGLLSASLLSFSLIFVFYAPIARMYISGVFFSIALLFYFFEIFFRKNTKAANYLLLGLFALLSALNQHINALFALTVCASGLFMLNRSNAKAYLVTCLCVVLAYIPHLPVTLYQLGVAGIGVEQGGFLPKPGLTSVFGFLKVMLGTGKSYLMVIGFILLCAMANKKIALSRQQVFLLVIFLVNFLVIYLYSVFRAAVFQHSGMLFCAMAIVVFICSLMDFKNKALFYTALISLSCLWLYKSYIKKDYFNQAVKSVFEYQFERTVHYKKLYGDNAVYPVFIDGDETMKKIYFNKYKTRFDCKIYADSDTISMLRFSEMIAGLRCDYLAIASSMPAQQAVCKEYFPYLIENTQTEGVNYKLYSKKEEDKVKVVEDDKVLVFSDCMNPAGFNYNKMSNVVIKGRSMSLRVDSLNEFPFDAIARYNEVVASEGEVLLVKCVVKPLKPYSSHITSCVAVNDLTSGDMYTYTSREASDFIVRKDSSVVIYTDNFFGTLHNPVKDKSKLACYLWNKDKENFEVSAYEISIIDYWPQKWRFWD